MRRPSLRALSAGSIVLALALAGCGSSAAVPSDPYELVFQSMKTTWAPVQVNVGVKATTSGQSVTLDPADLAFVLDTAGGKGALHVALPVAGLGIPAASLAQLGITGDSIDIDIVDDGTALFAKSALFQPMLQLLLGSSGQLPTGDLTGWLKLGTNAELAAFGAMAQGSIGGALPSAAASAGAENAAALKSSLDETGITFTLVGTEQHNGVNAQHLKIAIDTAKLANNPQFAAGAGQNYAEAAAALKQVSIGGDLWVDGASKHVVEADLHVAQTSGGSDTADVTVTAKDPDGSVPLTGPSSSVDVPIQSLFSQVLQMMSGSLGG